MTEEKNVYGDEAREDLMDDDEISPEEEGFMKGYEEEDQDKEEDDEDEDVDD